MYRIQVFCFFQILICFSTLRICYAQQLESFNHNGEIRTYNLFIPTGWDNSENLPLLMVLHGLTQTGSGVMEITNFNAIAQQDNFIVCYPSGLNNAWNANMNVSISNADDIGFLENLISTLSSQYNLDQSRIYFCGFSNGGFMSMKMLCESDICIAGVAAVSSTMSDTVYNNCSNAPVSSILQIHGTADPVVPYDGSISTGISVSSFLELWSNQFNCGTNTLTTDIPNSNIWDFSTAQEITYNNCPAGQLIHVKVLGGGHQWPGIETWNGGVGTINLDFYSPSFIWDFFKGKTCSSAELFETEHEEIEIYPNPSLGKIYIKCPINDYHIIIRDVQGNVLNTLQNNHSNMEIELYPGFYIFDIISDNYILSRKRLVIN